MVEEGRIWNVGILKKTSGFATLLVGQPIPVVEDERAGDQDDRPRYRNPPARS